MGFNVFFGLVVHVIPRLQRDRQELKLIVYWFVMINYMTFFRLLDNDLSIR